MGAYNIAMIPSSRGRICTALPVWLLALLLAVFGPMAPALAQRGALEPEAGSGRAAKPLARAIRHMVAAADPLAAQAGRDILRRGGNALDAAIAVQLVLNLVEPQSSGIGGGAFLMHYAAADQTVAAFDGRETAPRAANPDRFMRPGGPMRFEDAVHSGLSVGVPGTLAMLELAHRRHGRLPWAALFEPAIELASVGFPVSARLALLLRERAAGNFAEGARRYFFDAAGVARPAGHILVNPEFAATLKAVASGGTRAFTSGPIAEAIVAAVANAPNHKGDLTLEDLAAYRAKERAPVCVPYRAYRVCGMGPPSSGGLAVAQALMLLEPFDLGRGVRSSPGADALHLIAEAAKLAYADRDRYVADPDFAAVPRGLLDADYVSARRALIDPLRAADKVFPGTPPGAARLAVGADGTVEAAGTSHVSVVDGDGDAVALTTTIEAGFGSRLWAAGFLLNNEMTDFSFRPRAADGRPIANRIEAGKRPRSSMAPTIVLDRSGKVAAVLGSPGGGRIIHYVLKTLVALIDWQMDARQAAALPNFGARGMSYDLELPTPSVVETLWRPAGLYQGLWHALKLRPYGHRIGFDVMTSGVHVIVRRPDSTLEGGADPRREGVALGD
jgi:gamma-glutamyltranspeptidase / glutathione hydrolase